MVALPDFSFQALLDFVFGNITSILIVGGLGFAIWYFLKISSKPRLKPVDRSEIERMKFIERLKVNDSNYKTLWRGNKKFAKILKMSALEIPVFESIKKKKDPKKEEKRGKPQYEIVQTGTAKIIQLVVKPFMFKFLPITNPFSKDMAIQLKIDDLIFDQDSIIMPSYCYLDFYFGIYYDKTNEPIHTSYIKRDNVMRTDLNTLASIYFAKSQEQATFDPEHAHALALKEKEIQVEMAKRSGKMSQI